MPASPPSQFIPLISAFHPVKRVYRIKTLHLAFHRVLSEHPGRSFLQSLFAEHLRDARCRRSGGGKWGRRALGPCGYVLVWESSRYSPACFLNPSKTIASEKYAQQIDEMHQKLQHLKPVLIDRMGPILLYNNA